MSGLGTAKVGPRKTESMVTFSPVIEVHTDEPAFIEDHATGNAIQALSVVSQESTLTELSPRPWFMDPSSWAMRAPSLGVNYLDDSTLNNFLKEVVEQLFRWTDQGSNTFIHSRIYRPAKMPGCAQDAFMAISTYRHRNLTATPAILRMLEDKANALVGGDDAANSTAAQEPQDISHLPLLSQLAHVHALTAYTTLRLVDSDIRQRSLAQEHFPILAAWNNAMLATASRAIAGAHGIQALCEGLTPASVLGPDWQRTTDELWAAWAVAESIRRTWAVAAGVMVVFKLLQRGAVTCSGTVGITTRAGVWDAKSAGAWARLCSAVPAGLVHRFEAGWLIDTKPAEVDEFAVFNLKLILGEEAVADWVAAG